MTIEDIAKICHAANAAYCASIGDNSQAPWENAADWQRKSAIAGVQFLVDFPDRTPEDTHNAWLVAKFADGWTYGQIKDSEAKTHPCMMPYSELSEEHRRKDTLFVAIVNAFRDCL